MEAAPMILTKLRPFWGRVAIVESDVDQEERQSGLIVPIDKPDTVRRGVIMHVDVHDEDSEGSKEYLDDRIKVGTVVYFTEGVKISDLWIVNRGDIVAYEET